MRFIPLLKQGSKRRRFTIRFGFAFCLLVLALLALDRIFPPLLPDSDRDFARVVTDKDGQPLRVFADSNGVWRYKVALENVSPLYIEALLNYEDRWFYCHYGVNPLALMRASVQWLYHGRAVSGGSTLSMQVARILQPHSRTLWGKSYQMLRAVQLEWRFSKQEILELYLNYAPFGGPIEGVQAASYTYFGKPALQLTHAEAALLAVLPQSPSRFRPDRYAKRAEIARNKVLDRLQKFNVWDAQSIHEAKQEAVRARFNSRPVYAPLLARRLITEEPEAAVIRTHIDRNLQRRLELSLKNYIQSFPDYTSAAILVIDNKNMQALAYLGSADFSDAKRFAHVDMVQALRSPGSTLKPFLYGLAIDKGLIHEQSLLLDIPSNFYGYKPVNFDQDFNGPVSVRAALQRSLNVPAVQLMDAIGPESFYANLRSIGLKLHIAADSKPNLSLILGGAGTSLEQLTTAFALFARKGLTQQISYRQSDLEFEPRRLISEESAWISANIMAGASLNRFGAAAIESGRNKIAFKTGTSYGYRDAWVLATSEQYTVGIWVGRPDGTALRDNYGRHTAVPLLRKVLRQLPESELNLPEKPNNISKHTICWPLGTLKRLQEASWCMREKLAWLIDEQAPANSLRDPLDSFWSGSLVQLRLNAEGKRVSANCDDIATQRATLAVWPSSLDLWLPLQWRRETLLPPHSEKCSENLSLQKLKIVGINHRSHLMPPPGSEQLPAITLSTQGSSGETHWFIDGAWHSQSEEVQLEELTAGKHVVSVIDAAGNFSEIEFSVAY